MSTVRTRRMWVSIFTLACCLSAVGQTFGAPLTGTKSIPGDYATLALAIADLNLEGVGAGGVTLDLLAGNPQTAPAGGYVIGGAGSAVLTTSSTTNQITIQGNGNTITASAALTVSALNDAIFKLIGADWVTITGFTMQENAANTVNTPAASNNMTEWGVALLHASTSDGAQNNTISNNNISLVRTYANTWGVYSNNRHSATAIATAEDVANNTTGPNSGNKVYGNTISNVNMGVAFIGTSAAANHDVGNDVGGSSAATGNTISNWGGTSALSGYISNSGTSYCVFMNHQVNDNVSYNTISSATISGTPVTLRGIFKDYTVTGATIVGTTNITNNTLTITDNFTSGTFEHIRTQGTVPNTSTANLNNNIILNSSVGGAASSTTMIGIINSSAWGTLNMNNNVLRGNTSTATTGGFTGISNTGSVATAINITNNQVGNASGGAITFSAATSGAVTGIISSAGAAAAPLTITDNDVRGVSHTVAGTSTHTYISWTHGNSVADNINNNTFTNLNVNTTGSINFLNRGTTSMTATGSTSISNNRIVIGFNKGGAGGTVTFLNTGVGDVSPLGSSYIETGNNFSNVTLTGATTVAGWSDLNGPSGGTGVTKTITNNTFSNISTGAAAVTGIAQNFGGNNTNVSNNTISNITNQGAFTGIAIGSSSGGATHTYSNNQISGVTSTGTSGQIVGILGGSASITTCNVTGNTITDLSGTSTASVLAGIGMIAGSTNNISNNTVTGLVLSGTGTNILDGIEVTTATTTTISRNKVCNLIRNGAATANGVCNGIRIISGTTVTAFNNLVGDLRAPATSQTDAVRGISVVSTTALSTYNIYFNTVYLNASSSGTDFGTSGLFHATNATATTAALNLRNNIIVNSSTPSGTGLTVAHRRSAATSFPANYATTSDNNLFYCGTPDATHLIYNDSAGGSDQTLLAYQTRVSPADAASITGDPLFLSAACADAAFLHISSTSPAIGAAQPIAGITTDYDGELRDTSTPDIGADEFVVNCSGLPLAGTITGLSSVCSGFGTTLTLTGASTDNGITYQWKSGTAPGGPYTNILGTGLTQATGLLTSPAYFVCEVTCTLTNDTSTTAEKAVLVNPNPTVTVSPTSGLICNPSGSPVVLTAGGALTYSWSPAAGLSATTGDVVSASPASTTTYTVIGTDANGCTGTAAVTVTVAEKPAVSASATPLTICPGGSSQLNAVATKAVGPNYDLSSLTGQTYTTLAGGGITVINTAAQLTAGFGDATQDDGGVLITLPFTFTYMGNSFTQMSMSCNGWVGAGNQTSVSALNGRTSGNLFTTTVPNNTIAAWFKDMGANFPLGTGSMRHGLIGIDVYAFQWDKAVGSGFSDGASILISFQVNIHGPASSTPGRIEMIYGPTVGAIATAAAIGIENATGGPNQFINALNGSTTSTATSTAWPGNGNGYRFDPATFTYQWSPATFLNNAFIANPLASLVTTTTMYTVTATAASGCTNTATVTVTVEDNIDPVIVTCASDQGATADSNCEAIVPDFTAGVVATDNCSVTVTQSPLAGSTVTGAGPHLITITATDGANNTDTCTANLNVADPLMIVTGPQDVLACVGDMASFSVSANGAAGYQWRHNTIPLTNGGSISGATTNTLTINPLIAADAGAYDCVVTSVCGGNQTSTAANLTVNASPTISLQPVGGSIGSGSPFVFTVGANGGGLSYQWYVGITPLVDGGTISGATTDTLTISAASLSDAGTYTVVVSNNCGSITSDPAVLDVNAFATVSLVSPPCVTGNQLVVDVYMSASTSVIVGGQFFFAYNNTVLDFVSAVPGDAPFVREVYEVVNEPAGEINYAVGIDDGDTGTSANTVMARLTFNILQNVCTLTPNLVTWRASGPNGAENKLSDNQGQQVDINDVNLGAIRIDNVAPTITVCPSDISVHAAAGSCNSAPVTYAAAATDNCTAPGDIIITFSPPSGSTFPPGTHTVTVTATDECGNSSQCTFTVTNDGQTSVTVDVELGGGVMANGTFTRAITFALWNTTVDNVNPLHTVCVNMSFSGNFPAPKLGTANFLVPCQPTGYDCVTGRDRLHTLRRTISPIPISGTAYAPSFTGAKLLIGGNLDDSKFIDILDFGIYTTQDLSLAPGGASTVCGLHPPGFLHADITGNGIVNSLDYSFISNNFLMTREDNCNGSPITVVAGDGRTGARERDLPITSITIPELQERGLGHLAVMDLNQDGVFDLTDKGLWEQGVRPNTGGTSPPVGGSPKASQPLNPGTQQIPTP